jgi:hypothetical protein
VRLSRHPEWRLSAGANGVDCHRGRQVDFENYCPKAFALIGDLFSSFRTRCMIIQLRRREGKPTKKHYNPLIKERGNKLGKRAHELIVPLREKYEEMIRHSLEQSDAYSFLGDRDREIFEPLLVLCELLCPERMRELEHCAASIAANQSHDLRKISLIAEARVAAEAAGERLIKDMELIMRDYPRMGTYDLIIALRKLPTGGWDNYKRPGGITPDASGGMLLHDLLKRFGLQSGTVRLAPASAGGKEDTKQGFKYEDVLTAMKQHGIETHKSSRDHPIATEPAVPEAVPPTATNILPESTDYEDLVLELRAKKSLNEEKSKKCIAKALTLLPADADYDTVLSKCCELIDAARRASA